MFSTRRVTGFVLLAVLGLAVLSCRKPVPALEELPYPLLSGKLAFVRSSTSDLSRQYLVAVDADKKSGVVFGPVGATWGNVAISPDGRYIAFARFTERRHNFYQLHIVDFDGSHLKQLVDTGGFSRYPTWAPDGKRLYFSLSDPTQRLCSMNPDGSGLTEEHIPGFESNLGSFSFSPDRQRIVFAAIESAWAGIAVANLDGAGYRHLTTNDSGCCDLSPAWSPDGSRIVFVRQLRNTNGAVPFWWSLMTVEPDNGNVRNILDYSGATAPNEVMPAWSPEGDRIAFNYTPDSGFVSHVFLIDPDGANRQQVTSGDYYDGPPSWVK